MLSTVSPTILIILAGVVGLLVGLLISTLFNRESKPTVDTSLPEHMTKEGYVEAARLIYSPASRKIVTQLDGDFYKDFVSLTPEQKRRVLRLLQTWMDWSGQVIPQNESVKTIPAVANPNGVAIANPNPNPNLQTSDRPSLKTFEESLQNTPPAVEKLSDFGIKVPEIIEPIPATLSFGPKMPEAPQKEPLSIVEQINEVIEKLAAGTPDEAKQIRLTDNGHEGVIVWVGSEQFNGVDVVPYPDVQRAIRSAVARWEAETDELMKAKEKG